MQVVNTPRDYILGMLVGETRDAVERRLLFMLGAFFDGSGPAGRDGRYVMAGFTASCSTWADIAEQWKTALQAKPAIPKFKMSLARNHTWRGDHRITKDQMDRKIRKLSLLVTPPKTLFSVICSIDQGDFRELVESSGLRGDKVIRKALGKFCLTTPYTMLFHYVVATTLWRIHRLDICGDQVDFVFDRENKLFDDANALLRKLRPTLPVEIQNLLGDAVQRDEDKINPLQAADLIAARAKDQCNDQQNQKFRKAYRSLAGHGDHNATLHLEQRHIRAMLDKLRARPDVNPVADMS